MIKLASAEMTKSKVRIIMVMILCRMRKLNGNNIIDFIINAPYNWF